MSNWIHVSNQLILALKILLQSSRNNVTDKYLQVAAICEFDLIKMVRLTCALLRMAYVHRRRPITHQLEILKTICDFQSTYFFAQICVLCCNLRHISRSQKIYTDRRH